MSVYVHLCLHIITQADVCVLKRSVKSEKHEAGEGSASKRLGFLMLQICRLPAGIFASVKKHVLFPGG